MNGVEILTRVPRRHGNRHGMKDTDGGRNRLFFWQKNPAHTDNLYKSPKLLPKILQGSKKYKRFHTSIGIPIQFSTTF